MKSNIFETETWQRIDIIELKEAVAQFSERIDLFLFCYILILEI